LDKLTSQKNFPPINQDMNTSDYMVAFSGNRKTYCIGLVDIVNSTKATHNLNHEKLSIYYEIFLNSIAKILSRFGGFVIKNIGDSLLYYFPESSHDERKYGFMSCLESCLAIIEARESINNKLLEKGLSSINYRISADFGSVVLMKPNNSTSIDIIGTPVNICSKINRNAAVNGIIIGGDLYQIVKNFDDYEYKKIGDYSIGLKLSYPLYSVARKH